MSEVLFYHLTETALEHALPPLLEKSLERGWRVRVFGGDEGRLAFLGDHLWTYRDDGFLPHGDLVANEAAAQPILLASTYGNENAADVLFLLDQARPDAVAFDDFERVCVFFDGNDDTALGDARTYWKELKANGMNCKYWAQESGRWVEKSAT